MILVEIHYPPMDMATHDQLVADIKARVADQLQRTKSLPEEPKILFFHDDPLTADRRGTRFVEIHATDGHFQAANTLLRFLSEEWEFYGLLTEIAGHVRYAEPEKKAVAA